MASSPWASMASSGMFSIKCSRLKVLSLRCRQLSRNSEEFYLWSSLFCSLGSPSPSVPDSPPPWLWRTPSPLQHFPGWAVGMGVDQSIRIFPKPAVLAIAKAHAPSESYWKNNKKVITLSLLNTGLSFFFFLSHDHK